MTTATARTYPRGVTCWVDTEQPDLAAAQAFYAGLFGWTFITAAPPQAPVQYTIAQLDGQDVAGIGSAGVEGVSWDTYVAVDDADATAAEVKAAGGSVLTAPADAGPGGRDAVCADPSGARFHLWQARKRLSAQVSNAPGAWNFGDLHDASPQVDFYSREFGWEYTDLGFATMVRERAESAASAQRLGAEVLASEDSQWSRTALIRDPQGAEFTLSQFTPPT